MWLPFICLAAGAVLSGLLHPVADRLLQISVFTLLLGLGAKIGADKALLAAIPVLGMKSLFLCILASGLSIILIIIWEKIFLKNQIDPQSDEKNGFDEAFTNEYHFILLVILCLLGGIGLGAFYPLKNELLTWVINLALVAVYVSVGAGLKEGLAGLGTTPNKFAYLAVPILILTGSMLGGLAGAWLLDLKPLITAGIGGGTGYYSLAAAMITQKAGAELGFIAFMVNFFREALTFFLTPLLVRISPLAPIALGGATTMDTTLAVMKQSLGEGYVIIAFVSGAILTLAVPFMLMFLLSF